jgi:Rps23 Pro-64 3,4-dihydroxylase Tpa1-like proline 4-hydroxylase
MNSKLLENNYIIIPNFIDSGFAKSLAREFKEYCKNNNLKGDEQCPNSQSKHNYISFLELLCEKTPEISSILGDNVLPTYAYSRVYHKNSILEKHTDRDACEISLTLNLDGDEDWPIFIETPCGEEKTVNLRPGDAMMYLGKIASHWRDEYIGEYYTQVFLHYVRSRGECSYAYFDNRKKKLDEQQIVTDIHENESEFDSVKNNDKEHSLSPTLIIPKSKTKLEDFIHVFDDIFPKDFCEEILEEYSNTNEWSSALVGNGEINRNSRNCEQISISDPEIIEKNIKIRKSIDDKMYSYVNNAVTKYKEQHPHFSIDVDTGYQLLKYGEGQFYGQHVDSYKNEQRSISCSIQLNENYDGGEFAFFDREIMIRTKTGSAIVFPSNFMYPHEIMPIIKGTRYSIVTWMV